MFKKILLSLLITFPVIAKAEWIEFDRDEEFTTYLDPLRLTPTDKYTQQAEFWVKSVVHTDLTKDGLGVGDYRLYKYRVKCKTSEIALLAGYSYSKSKVIDSQVLSYHKYMPVIPDSVGELYLELVCTVVYGDE